MNETIFVIIIRFIPYQLILKRLLQWQSLKYADCISYSGIPPAKKWLVYDIKLHLIVNSIFRVIASVGVLFYCYYFLGPICLRVVVSAVRVLSLIKSNCYLVRISETRNLQIIYKNSYLFTTDYY